MPELPEIITIRNDLRTEIIGKRIKKIICLKDYKLDHPSMSLLKHLKNNKITGVSNTGKLLLIDLSSGYHIAVHLKMTGNLLFNINDPYVRVSVVFDDDNSLNFSTVRLFEYFEIWNKEKVLKYKKNVGKDPIENNITFDEFKTILRKSSSPIKTSLLNQKKISGLGNIYVNEALYLAKINPNKQSSSITDNDLGNLLNKIKIVLSEGIKHRGSSINRFKDIYGKPGFQQNHFHIYGKKGEICDQCNKERINYQKINGRGTFFCPNCQK